MGACARVNVDSVESEVIDGMLDSFKNVLVEWQILASPNHRSNIGARKHRFRTILFFFRGVDFWMIFACLSTIGGRSSRPLATHDDVFGESFECLLPDRDDCSGMQVIGTCQPSYHGCFF